MMLPRNGLQGLINRRVGKVITSHIAVQSFMKPIYSHTSILPRCPVPHCTKIDVVAWSWRPFLGKLKVDGYMPKRIKSNEKLSRSNCTRLIKTPKTRGSMERVWRSICKFESSPFQCECVKVPISFQLGSESLNPALFIWVWILLVQFRFTLLHSAYFHVTTVAMHALEELLLRNVEHFLQDVGI